MAFVPFPDTAQFEVRYIDDGQKVENVYHVDDATPWDATTLAAMCAVFVNWWDVSMQPLVSDAVQLVGIVAKDMSAEFGVGIDYATGLPLTGGNTSGDFPNNVTLAVKWSTGLSGRSFRGRTYHIGLSKNQVAGQIVVATPLANIVAAYNALIADVDAAGGALSVASRFDGGVERTSGVTTHILSASADPVIDSQRRRLPGRGS